MIKRPIVIACIGYILGIIYGLYFNINIALIFLIIMCSLYLIINKNIKRYMKVLMPRKFILLLVAFGIIGSMYINYLEKKYNKVYDIGNPIKVQGTVENIEKQQYFNKYVIKIKNINNKKYNNISFLMYSKTVLNYGDYINVKVEYEKPNDSRNYKGFSYKNYLKKKGIYGILKPVENIEIKENQKTVISSFIYNTRNLIKDRINENLSIETAGLFTGIILGDKSNIEDNVNDSFKQSNMAHILAVSGAHVNYIILTMSILLKRATRKSAIVVTIIVLMFFMMLTGFTPSVVRACIMAIFALVSNLIYTKSDIYNNLSISSFIILVVNPYNLLNIGFQLSYLGTIGIVILSKKLNEKSNSILEEKEHTDSRLHIKNVVKEKMKVFIINMICISVSVQIFILPIIIINYNTISFNFLISGIVATPLFSCIMIIGIIAIILGPIGNSLFSILEILLKFLMLVSKFISNIPFSQILIITPNLIWIISYYIVLIAVLFLKSKLEKRLNFKIKLKQLVIVLISICLIVQSIQNLNNNELNIYFIDVGQGDSTLIITPNKKTILIDGGGEVNFDVGKNTLLPYLLDRGVSKIDYMVFSHFDSDHCNGLLYVIQNIKVNNVILTKQFETSENYEKFIKLAKDKKLKVTMVEAGNRINIEKNLYIDILWPCKENVVYENVLNNNSLVCKLVYKDFGILFTGDIEKIAEKVILQQYKNMLSATVLKVAHHGSKTSTSKEFLEAVKPKIALIGVGANNTFGHPADVTLKKLNSIGCKIYRTDEAGEILLKVNNKGINIQKMIN